MPPGEVQNTGRLLTLLSILSVGLLGCRTSQPPSPVGAMPLYLDEAPMQAEVFKHVSVGMPVTVAQQIMERHGFKCRIDETPQESRCVRVRPQDDPAVWCVSDEIFVCLPVAAGRIEAIKVHHQRTAM
jgi:hypothetical protein